MGFGSISYSSFSRKRAPYRIGRWHGSPYGHGLDSSGFAALLTDAQIDNIVPAMHFTALPLCKPMAKEILEEEQDDPVCTDPAGTDRAAVHATIVDLILSDLGL